MQPIGTIESPRWRPSRALLRAFAVPHSPTSVDTTLDLRRLAVVALELGLVLLAFKTFSLEENSRFTTLAELIFGGFVLHAVLPLQYRLPFFLGLSLAAFAMLYGAP